MSDQDDATGRPRRPRVAIVDDEPEVARVLARAAQADGFDPVVVRSGRELVTLVEHDPPDVVVLDIVMPGMDGNEILLALRRARSLPRIILITGYGEAFLRPPAILAGDALVGTILKPFQEADLGVLLRRAIDRE